MRDQRPEGVQPSGCPNVAQLPTARNILRATRAGRMDTWILTLNHWDFARVAEQASGCLPPFPHPDHAGGLQTGPRAQHFARSPNPHSR